jgi:single-strand DNA-binding protein
MVGRTTKQLELKRTNNGTAVTTFSLAVEHDFKNANGEKETGFFECCAWKGTAEYLCQYSKKGSMIAVDGRLQTRAWQDKDGNNRKSVEIVVDRAYIMPDGKKDGYAERNEEPNIPAAVMEFAEAKEDGELPF